MLSSNSNFTQPESSNVGIVIRDALSLHRFVNYLINYSIHRRHHHSISPVVPEGKDMTQVISSLSFAHSTWTMMSPVLHRNVLMKGVPATTMVVNGVVTKTSLQKLVSVVNTVLEVVAARAGDA